MSKITDHELSTLRALPIEGVAQRLGLTVNRHVSLCPFHDDRHPSLHYNVSKNTYRCYVCDAHGGPIDLAMALLPSVDGRSSFTNACEWLADENNIILTEYANHQTVEKKSYTFQADRYARYFDHPYISPLASAFLYDQRHLDARVIRYCRLTSWKEWLQIPYFSIEGELTGVQWRNLGPLSSVDGRSIPRFLFPKGSKCHIYNLPVIRLLQEGEPLYITEGCSDCWSMLSSGHKAIAIPSATTLRSNDLLKVLRQLAPLRTPLHIYPDQDIPGEKLYLQLTAFTTFATFTARVHIATARGYEDCRQSLVRIHGHAAACRGDAIAPLAEPTTNRTQCLSSLKDC